MKYCQTGEFCGYRYQEGSLLGCKYEGYCDFQRPRDSRNAGMNRKEGKSPLNAKDFPPQEEGNMI